MTCRASRDRRASHSAPTLSIHSRASESGAGVSRYRVSRPARCEVTRPAPASVARCFATAWRVIVVETGFEMLPVASAQACAAVNAWAWEARLQAVARPVLIAG